MAALAVSLLPTFQLRVVADDTVAVTYSLLGGPWEFVVIVAVAAAADRRRLLAQAI